MNSNFKGTMIKWTVTFMVAGLVTIYYISSRWDSSDTLVEHYRILADGFTIPGLLLLCFGALLVISGTGELDGLYFGMKSLVRRLIPAANFKREETYYEYKMARKAKNSVHGFGYIIIIGAVFMLIAAFFIWKFYQLY